MSRDTLSLTCLCWLTLAGFAAAQPSFDDPGVARVESFSGGVSFAGNYFQVQNMTGNGVGYTNGFTQLGHLLPFWLNDDLVLGWNNRVMITDTQQVGGNTGAFLRYYDFSRDRIFGVNAFYDIDRSIQNFRYRQVGFGVETLGEFWDFRANGYVPTTTGDNFLNPIRLVSPSTPVFSGHGFGFMGLGQYQESLSGGDAEIGAPLAAQTPWLRGYAGVYAYQAKGESPVGFRGRIEGWVSDDLQLGVQVTNDKQFGTNVNASVNFLFSGWRPTRWFPNFATRERMLTPTQRNWRVATGTYEQLDFVPGFNPRTGNPYFITWVDNSNLGVGDGTYENPYTFLPGATPEADLILVNRGVSGTTPIGGSMVLTPYQRMLGQGREHAAPVYAQYGSTTIPTTWYNLPGFTNTGLYPVITSGGNAVSITDHNEVSAFTIQNSAGAAINNFPIFGSNDFNLNCLNLINNAGGGIMLANGMGNGIIEDVFAQNNAAGGIGIDSGVSPLNLYMRRVTSSSTVPGAQPYGIFLNADNADITADIANVITNGNQVGIVLSETNNQFDAMLTEVTSNGNVGAGGDGIRVLGTNGAINLELTNITTNGNARYGIDVEANGTPVTFDGTGITSNGNGSDNLRFALSNGSSLTGQLLNSTFNGSTGGSGIVVNTDASTVGTLAAPFLFQGVNANNNNQYGMQNIASTGSVQRFNIVNSSFTANGIDGIADFVDSSQVFRFIDPTNIDQNVRDGYHFEATNTSVVQTIFEDDTLLDNGRSAIYGNPVNNSTVNLTVTRSNGLRSGADGVFINANNSTVNFTATDSSFNNSGRTTLLSSALRFDANNSLVTMNLLRTPGQDTALFPASLQTFGLQLNLNGATTFNGTVTNGNFSNNRQDGIRAVASGTTAATLNLTDTPVSGNGQSGLNATANAGTTFNINATGSGTPTQTTFSNNGGSGVSGRGVHLMSQGTMNVNLNNVGIVGNRLSGIDGNATAGGVLVLNATNNTAITGNNTSNTAGAGGAIFTNNLSRINAAFANANISNNTRDGVNYQGTGSIASTLTFANTTVNGNLAGGAGLLFNESGGALSLSAFDTTFSNNNGNGVFGTANNGANVLMNSFTRVTGNGNQLAGMRLLVDNGSAFNGSVNGGSFSGNGLAGNFDGVNMLVQNASTGVICFDGTQVNNNTQEGFDFDVLGAGSTLNAALITSGNFGTLTATGNTTRPVDFNIGAGASGTLFMDGNNVFTATAGTIPILFNANGAANAGFGFSGSLSGYTADGVEVNMTNVAQAWIDINGGGTGTMTGAVGNTSDGFDINLNTVTFATTALAPAFIQTGITALNPFQVVGYTFSTHGSSAIDLSAINVTMPAVGVGVAPEAISNNTITGSGDDGIEVDFSGTSVVNNFSINNNNVSGSGQDGIDVDLNNTATVNTLNVNGNTSNNNTQSGIDISGSAGTTLNNLNINGPGTINNNGVPGGVPNGNAGILLDLNGVLGTPNITMNGLVGGAQRTINGNGGPGIQYTLTNTPVNDVVVSNNSINQNSGAGILAVHNNSTADTITMNDNVVTESAGHGISLTLNNSTLVNNVTMLRNTVNMSTLAGGANGINVVATGTPIGIVNLSNNLIGNSTTHGINLDLTGSPVTTLNLNDNQIGQLPNAAPAFVDDSLPVIRAGFNANTFARNDDGSTGLTNPGFAMNFFGTTFNQFFINNNGNISFNNAVFTYTPDPIVTNGEPMLAPFWADVDTRGAVGNPVTFGTGTIAGRNAFGVNWIDVDYFSGDHPGQTNTFQLILIDRSDVAAGDFDFEFNYGQVTWETGNASGGVGGLGGDSARAGYTNGTTQSFEFAGSAVNGAFLDSGPGATSLIQNRLNSLNNGRYAFAARNGGIGAGGAAPNGGDGIRVSQVNSNINETTVNRNLITDNGGRGVNFNTIDNSTNADMEFLTNTIERNGSDGIRFGDVINNSVVITAGNTMEVQSNTINENTGHGVNFANFNGADLGRVDFDQNTITTNAGDGVRMLNPLTNNNLLTMNFTNNTISNNANNGINYEISNGENLTINTFTGNTIGSTGNGNGTSGTGMGFRANITGDSALNATIGATGQTANSIVANRDAGIGIIIDNALPVTSSLNVVNTTITNTVNGNNASFAGVGLGVILNQNSVMSQFHVGDAAVQNTTFNSNAAGGFLLDMHNNAVVQGQMQMFNVQANENTGNGATFQLADAATIGNNVIDGNMDLLIQGTVAGASMSDNTGHQLSIIRTGFSNVAETQITGMTFDGREGSLDGINMQITNSVGTTTYLVDNNTITGNRDGIAIDELASAQVIAGIFQNTISTNRTNGVRIGVNQASTLGDTNGLVDLNAIGGPYAALWTNPNDGFSVIDGNTFTNNGLVTGGASSAINVTTANGAYANLRITGTLGAGGRQTFTGDRNGITINNGSNYFNGGALPPGVVARNRFLIQGADLTNNVVNGISIANTGINGLNRTGDYIIGDETLIPVALDPAKSVTISQFGGNGIQFAGASSNLNIRNTQITHAIGSTGGNDGINLTIVGNDAVTIENTTILRSGGDGIDISDTTASGNSVTIRQTESSQNFGRGLLVNIQKDGGLFNGGVGYTAASTYNIGNFGDTGANRNRFLQNGLQGMLFLQRAASGADGFFQAQDINTPAGNNFPASRLNNNSVDNLVVAMNIINNDIQNNGNRNIANDNDGATFLVGSSTRLIMNYSGNGRETDPGAPLDPVLGNLGDDFRLAPIVSANPANSIEVGPNNAPAQVGDGLDTYFFDPVAHVNLLFGGNVGVPTTSGLPIGVNGLTGPYNFGEQINVSNGSFAPTGIAGVQTLFTNNDVYKGINRTTQFNGTVDTNAVGGLSSNRFSQVGVAQPVAPVFGGVFTLSGNPFP